MSITAKPCSRCERTLPLHAFSPNPHGVADRDSICLCCRAEAKRQKRAAARSSVPAPARALLPRWPAYYLNSRMDLLGAALRALTE